MNFREKLGSKSAQVESYLETCLGSIDMPAGLREAMNYSLLAGGKRLRPVLFLTSAEVFAPELAASGALMPFAAAIECIHTYSLVHDDLPAMDDDDLRRGKPSNHKAFGEATAILAGDALLTDAFAFMARPGLGSDAAPASASGSKDFSRCSSASSVSSVPSVPAGRVLAAIACLSAAAGSAGMVGGQYLDMEYTANADKTLDELKAMQAAKTGALIRASCECGAIMAGAGPAEQARIAEYGRALGAAFQIVDDILDETGDEATLGKPVGSDAGQGKVTYPALVGLERSRELAQEAAELASGSLGGFENQAAEFLRELVEYVLKRAS